MKKLEKFLTLSLIAMGFALVLVGILVYILSWV